MIERRKDIGMGMTSKHVYRILFAICSIVIISSYIPVISAANDNQIILPKNRIAEITIISVEASADSELGIYKFPDLSPLFLSTHDGVGKSLQIGPAETDSNLVFYIKTSWYGVENTVNTFDNPDFFIIEQIQNSWILKCEDAVSTDRDYNDIIFEVKVLPLPATIDIDPNTLNLKSKGKWITAYIELPEGYDVNNIDVSTIKLEPGEVPVDPNAPTTLGDYDSDGISDLMVKFNRANVVANLVAGNEVKLTVTGKLKDETEFEGNDMIRVIK